MPHLQPYRLCCLLLFLAGGGLAAGDWPEWRGPRRDGCSEETGFLRDWPKAGPPLAWKARNLGHGFATVSVAAGRVFTLVERGGELVITALDERTGA